MSEFDRFRPSATEAVPGSGDEFSKFRPQGSKPPEASFDVTPPPGLDPAVTTARMRSIDAEIGRGTPKERLLQGLQAEGWKINKGLPVTPPSPTVAPSWLSRIPFSGIEGAYPSGTPPINPLDLAKAGGRSAAELALFPVRAAAELGAASAGRAFSMEGATGAATTVSGKTDPMLQEKITRSVNDAIEGGKGFVFGAPTEGTAAFEEGLGIPFEALGYVPQKIGAYVTEKTGDPLLGKAAEYASLIGTFKAGHKGGKIIQEGIDRLVRSKKPITVETPSPAAANPPVEPPGATTPPETAPTPPKEPIVTPTPTVAPGTPEFYKAEAERLGIQFAGVTETGLPSRPKMVVFQDGDNKTGAGSFTLNPGETVEQALIRARARYEAPKPAAETGPVAVPEPPKPATEPPPAPAIAEKRAEERPVRSSYPESQVPDIPTVESDMAAVKTSLDQMEKEYVIKKEKDPSSMDTLALSDQIKAYRNSLGQLETRKAELQKPAPAETPLVNLPKEEASASGSEKLPTGIPQTETSGEKFANVRKKKIKDKKGAAEPTLQQRILRAGGIKIDPAMRGEFAQYGLRQGEGALARLYRSEKHPGYKKARGWDQWIETLIEDGTLPQGAGISDLFEAIKKNKRPGAEIVDEEFARAAAESAAKTARETVPENEIALGDSFRIDGEKFKAVRYDERGNLIVKDGREITVEANAGLQVDGGKEGVFPGEIPKGEPFKLKTEESPTAEASLIPEAAGAQDELFPGERSKYRAPEKGPPAPPPEGGLFGKGEEGFAPEKDFRTKPAEPVDEGKPMSRSGIAKFLSEKFDIPLRVGRFRNALGIFKVGPEVIRTRFAHDIEVISHEIGHALHKFLWPDARTGSGGLAAGPLRAFRDELIPIATKPRAGGSKNAEGFAEFVRRYVVNPDEAKRVAPKFFKFFEEELDKKSPDSKAILLKARADYKRWLEQPALARVMGSINQTPKSGASLTFKKLYTNTIDALYPLEEITKEMAKVKNIDQVPANLNPYKLAHLLAGWKGKADAWLEHKPFSFKTYKFSKSVKSFKKIMDPIKANRDIFDAYLVSRRSVQLGEVKTGILDADARKVIEDMDREHPEFKQAAIELKHYQNGLLRYLYDGGIINGEQFLRMRQANEDYVPFYRVMDYERVGGGAGSGPGHEVKGAPVYRFKGSWRDIVSPTESIIKNTYAFINAAEKNAVGKAIVALSKEREGMGKFVEKIPADTQRIAVKDTELEDMLRKYGKWKETTQFQTTEQTIRGSIKDETGADIPAGDRGTRIMKERAVEALKTRGYSQAEAETIVSRIASAKNETARSRIIERVVERATVRNTVREFGIEIPEGLAYIYRKSPNTPKGNVITVMERGKPTYYEVDQRIYNAFHALDKEGANTLIRILSVPSRLLRVGATLTPEFSLGKNPIRDQWTAFINSKYGYVPGVDLAKGLFTAVKKNEDYWRWKVGGGEHSAMVSMDREYFDKTWTEIMRDRGVKSEALHVAQHPIDVLRALSEYTEEATRLGEFRKGLKTEGKGLPPGKTAIQDAAYASREVTLPFSRMGAKTKSVNMIVAFWNANMQDLDKIHRQFKEYPLQTSIRTMAAITLPSVLLAIANHGNKKIDEIAQWQKDIFWLVDVGPFVMRIPKPFIMGILFGSFPERIVKNIMDKDPHAFDGLIDSLSRGSSPGWMPTFANPIIENWANKSRFTNRQIVPKAREDLSPAYQYAPYTTETAKLIGKHLARIPGMKGSDLENLVVSPAKLENLVRGYTGGLGMWALNAANASLKTAGVVPSRVEPSKQLADYPLIKAFVVRYPTADTESIQRFFDNYKEAEMNLKTSKFLFKKFEPKPAMEILSREDVARLVSIKTALTNAHKIVDAVYENPKMAPEEKRRIIDQTYINMSVMAREGNAMLDKYKKRKAEAR